MRAGGLLDTSTGSDGLEPGDDVAVGTGTVAGSAPSWFHRAFEVLEKLGSGDFGAVLKVCGR